MIQPDDERLSAWLDGELDAAEAGQVEAWLHEHPEDAARVRLWAADRDALRARFDPLIGEPVPDALKQVVWRRQRPSLPWARAAMVTGLVAGGALIGATLGWQLKPGADGVAASARSGWTQRAAVAHAVYAPEVRHPVEVDVTQGSPEAQRAQEEHLARWLTKRLEMPVRLFDMRAHGFELVGGRLLPDITGPSAQLMYQNGGGQRVTVYLRRPEAGTDTSFRYKREGDVGMFYWIEDGFGYALVGTVARERLLEMAESAYRQAERVMPPAPVKPSS